MPSQENRLSREEWELVGYFRELPVQQQLDILSMAESHFNAFERMKELSMRQVETGTGETGEDGHGWH